MTALAQRVGDDKNCQWIYRFRANPGMPRGGVLPPTPVLAPGSALGSRPRVALSSAQVPPVYSERGHQTIHGEVTARRGARSVTRPAGPGVPRPASLFPRPLSSAGFPQENTRRVPWYSLPIANLTEARPCAISPSSHDS
jgi:hypothetical protein